MVSLYCIIIHMENRAKLFTGFMIFISIIALSIIIFSLHYQLNKWVIGGAYAIIVFVILMKILQKTSKH